MGDVAPVCTAILTAVLLAIVLIETGLGRRGGSLAATIWKAMEAPRREESVETETAPVWLHRRSSRVGLAVGAFAGVFLLRLALQPTLGTTTPYLGFLFSVVVSTRSLGSRAGLATALLAIAAANYAFHDGPPGFSFPTAPAAAQILLFLLTSLTLVALDSALVEANRRLRSEAEVRRAAEGQARRLASAMERRVEERTRELSVAMADSQRLNEDLERRAFELSKAIESLESFSYSVSHDLKAPLRAINTQVGMLLEDEESLSEGTRVALERVRMSARKMADLTDDLLLLSQVDRSELRIEDVGLTDLVREAIATEAAHSPRDRVSVELQEGVVVRGDRRLLGILVHNLVHNAWKFSAGRPTTTVRFFVAQSAGGACYCVEDEGAGFEESCADRMFEPFQRLHSSAQFEGTGVGLAIVRRVVERHGGRVWAHGGVGKGARVCFTLGQAVPMAQDRFTHLTTDSDDYAPKARLARDLDG